MRCTYLPVSLHRSNDLSQYWNLNQLSIAYALRLGLGPDLPWADEPSPGILRFSAGRILTCLFAYLYRHSHFLTLQHSFQYTFVVLRTLLYQLYISAQFRSFGGMFEPRYIFGAKPLDQ